MIFNQGPILQQIALNIKQSIRTTPSLQPLQDSAASSSCKCQRRKYVDYKQMAVYDNSLFVNNIRTAHNIQHNWTTQGFQ